MLPTIKIIITKGQLGSSKNRTHKQELKAREFDNDYIVKAGNNILLVFTDGCATPNPGPSGAGLSIYWSGMQAGSTDHTIPVSSCSTSCHGEIQAIESVLEIIKKTATKTKQKYTHNG
jgi:hypothetical protein